MTVCANWHLVRDKFLLLPKLMLPDLYQHPFVTGLLQVNKCLENFHLLLVALGEYIMLRGR